MDSTAPLPLSTKQIFDVLRLAFQDGSPDWLKITNYNTPFWEFFGYPDGSHQAIERYEGYPLNLHGDMTVVDTYGMGTGDMYYHLNAYTIGKGLRILMQDYPQTYAAIESGTYGKDDAIVFLQCCLFQKVIHE